MVETTFVAAVGGEQESVFKVVVPRDSRNRWLTAGNGGRNGATFIYFLDTDESALPAPNNSANDFLHNVRQGTALRDCEHITGLQIKGTPKITTLGAETQQVPAAAELSEVELKHKIESYLFSKGPLYIHAQDNTGKDVALPGKDDEVTKLEDMPPIGPDFTEDGVRTSDLRTIFVPGELRSLELALKYMLETDGRAINVYQPEAGAPGPNGMMCYVMHHKNNSAYSTERKVEPMEQDPPQPPPPPPPQDPGGGEGGHSGGAADQPKSPPPPPSAGGHQGGDQSGAKQAKQRAHHGRSRPISNTCRATTTLILMVSMLQGMVNGVHSRTTPRTASSLSHFVILDQAGPQRRPSSKLFISTFRDSAEKKGGDQGGDHNSFAQFSAVSMGDLSCQVQTPSTSTIAFSCSTWNTSALIVPTIDSECGLVHTATTLMKDADCFTSITKVASPLTMVRDYCGQILAVLMMNLDYIAQITSTSAMYQGCLMWSPAVSLIDLVSAPPVLASMTDSDCYARNPAILMRDPRCSAWIVLVLRIGNGCFAQASEVTKMDLDCFTWTTSASRMNRRCLTWNDAASKKDSDCFAKPLIVSMINSSCVTQIASASLLDCACFALTYTISRTDSGGLARIVLDVVIDLVCFAKAPAVLTRNFNNGAQTTSASTIIHDCFAWTSAISMMGSDYVTWTILTSTMDRACSTRTSAVSTMDLDYCSCTTSFSTVDRYCFTRSSEVLMMDSDCFGGSFARTASALMKDCACLVKSSAVLKMDLVCCEQSIPASPMNYDQFTQSSQVVTREFDYVKRTTLTSTKDCDCLTQTSVIFLMRVLVCFALNTSTLMMDRERFVHTSAVTMIGSDHFAKTTSTSTKVRDCFEQTISVFMTDSDSSMMDIDGLVWVTLTSTIARDCFVQVLVVSTTDVDSFAEATSYGTIDCDYFTRTPTV